MSPTQTSPQETREGIMSVIRSAERFVLITHEHPDGDALGSLLGMHRVLGAMGKDSVMFICDNELPLPYEYRWLDLSEASGTVPADIEQRVIVFLDCGNIDRNPVEAFRSETATILNIDHHHDNTRFGTVDHVVGGASCTAELVWDLMTGLGVELTAEIAEPLYIGLITDTGRFMYENAGVRSHLMAAECISAGVEPARVNRAVYEGWPEPKLRLFALGLSRARREVGGALTFAFLSARDFEDTGAEESYTEGIVDRLRSVEGTKVAALARELHADGEGGPRWKISLRSSDGSVDVSAIAREAGGGGHRQAAGFRSELSQEGLVAFLCEHVAAQL
jgi:phosphoesterase RecJ-like protein